MSQKPIMATANDAILSKLSTSQLGYYYDPFLPHMAKNATGLTASTANGNGNATRTRINTNTNTITSNSNSNTSRVMHIQPTRPLARPLRPTNQFQFEQQEEGRTLPAVSERAAITNIGEGETIYGHGVGYEHTNSTNMNASPSNSLNNVPPHLHPNPFPNPMLQKRFCAADRHSANMGGSHHVHSYSHSHPHPHHSHLPVAVAGGSGQMHQPVIRRGTHARVCVVDYAITTFLSLCQDLEEVQVVILGSGRDTTYLRSQCDLLHDKCLQSDVTVTVKHRTRGNVRWYEVDHPSVIRDKYDLLRSCDLIDFNSQKILDGEQNESFIISPQSIRTDVDVDVNMNVNDAVTDTDKNTSTTLTLEPCHLVSYDLRNSFEFLLRNLEQNHSFDKHIPTLFIMECVQMYLPEKESRDIIHTITEECSHPMMAIFDPIIQHDQFGQVMAQNLTKAGIADPSMSLVNTRTLREQVDKLHECGFERVTGCDFYSAYEMLLTAEDRRRANMAEMLDEVEEWMLIMRHYCFLVAAGGVGGKVGDDTHEERRENGLKGIEEAFCSVEKGNVFGFVDRKCMSRIRESGGDA